MNNEEKPGHPGRPGHPVNSGAEAPKPADMDLEALVDISEKGGLKDGTRQRLDERAFVPLPVFTGCVDTKPLIRLVEGTGIEAALYLDVHDPKGVGLVTMSRDP